MKLLIYQKRQLPFCAAIYSSEQQRIKEKIEEKSKGGVKAMGNLLGGGLKLF
jgi:hypothetical protein